MERANARARTAGTKPDGFFLAEDTVGLGERTDFTKGEQPSLISLWLIDQFERVGWGNNPTSTAGAVKPKLAFESLDDERGFPLPFSFTPV